MNDRDYALYILSLNAAKLKAFKRAHRALCSIGMPAGLALRILADARNDCGIDKVNMFGARA